MKTKKPGAKGGDFEERLRTYFDHAGFYAVRGVPFLFEGEDVSDIDVWLYERPNAVSRRRTIVDAKSKQRPKAVERILWLKGFQQGLGVEGAVVATSDRRSSVRRFAGSLGVSVLDGEAVDRLISTDQLENADRIPSDVLREMLGEVDVQQRTKEWRARLDSGKAGLVANLGFLSANENIDNARFFLQNALIRSGSTKDAATRAFLISAAYSAISLDFAMKDWSFRSTEERREGLRLGLKFGEGGASSTLDTIRLALGLVRQYSENGGAIARQIEMRINDDAGQMPVDVIAEYVAKVSAKDTLFKVARELDDRGHTTVSYRFDDLSIDAKSFVGVLLDYMGVGRKRIDELLPLSSAAVFPEPSSDAKGSAGDHEPRVDEPKDASAH